MSAPRTDARGFVDRAVLRLSFVELWERYSYFTLFALLPLFVAAPVARGGLGWADGDSLRFFGIYLLVVQVAPLAGGWLADGWLGGRRSLRLGAVCLLLGHLAMAALTLVPTLSGPAAAVALARDGGALGGWWPPAALTGAARTAYVATSALFYCSVGLVAFGNGLFKPVLTVAVGRLPHAGEAERSAAFTTFFLYLNIGGLASLLLGGALAQNLGWTWAFGTSAGGMVVSLVAMTLLAPTYITPFVSGGGRGEAMADEPEPDAVRHPPAALALALALFVLVCTFSYQSYGFVSLFTARLVDRGMFGLEVPPSWFTAVNPVTIMVLTPVLVGLWKRGRAGHDSSAGTRVGASLVVMGLAFALLLGAAIQVRHGGLASPAWVVVAIALIACGELLFTPALTAAVARLSPPGRRSLAIGSLTAAGGIGAWLSGRVGAIAIEGDRMLVLAVLAAAAFAAGLALVAGRRMLARLSL